ncbi:H-NS histone family protein [Sinirhodobacter populi]|uniref:H-NS histone family protein n=1 Tax=Paenirhodobacter populi TaxID=2306993 RepID=A0A443KCB1_9RHOB|nr:H-NS histone family protein [Sinirhodobacter populi]RWR30441.1 H-NS histone family protein [Sinirhodobacter populi]
MTDYQEMTTKQLQEERLKIEKALAQASERDLTNALDEVTTLLSGKYGLRLDQFISFVETQAPRKRKDSTRSKPRKIWQHPIREGKIWTGRGRRPHWVDEFEVQPIDAPPENGSENNA